jgi:hypothetical protein
MQSFVRCYVYRCLLSNKIRRLIGTAWPGKQGERIWKSSYDKRRRAWDTHSRIAEDGLEKLATFPSKYEAPGVKRWGMGEFLRELRSDLLFWGGAQHAGVAYA